jgi:hypothetical protein
MFTGYSYQREAGAFARHGRSGSPGRYRSARASGAKRTAARARPRSNRTSRSKSARSSPRCPTAAWPAKATPKAGARAADRGQLIRCSPPLPRAGEGRVAFCGEPCLWPQH